ncbi:hypothetical protein [Okeania sp.]|nr:hypothetical protein [Okeania sp.]MEB3340946.1 hypothetical protein [Okeania sp.]
MKLQQVSQRLKSLANSLSHLKMTKLSIIIFFFRQAIATFQLSVISF